MGSESGPQNLQSPEPRATSELSRPSRTVALYASRRTVGWLLPVLATAIVLAPPFAPTAQAQTSYRIDTFAGLTGVGDGGAATAAQLRFPYGVAVGAAGNLYIADTQNHRIRKVDSGGTITTIAGTGEGGFSGDGGAATAAELSSPSGVAVDDAGNLYIVCWFNQRIRKVDSTGTITTIAGTEYGFSGDGGPATKAQLNSPYDVAVDDAGNLYIADRENQRIRKVDNGGTITTIAGTGVSGFGGDGGPATEAQLSSPRGVAVNGEGSRYYIADSGNDRIRLLTLPPPPPRRPPGGGGGEAHRERPHRARSGT